MKNDDKLKELYANTKIENESQFPRLPGKQKAKTKKGTRINLPIVKIFGSLKIIKNFC